MKVYRRLKVYQVEGTPVEGTPVEGTPVEGTPVEGTPVEGTPVEGTPVEGTPVEGTPVEGTPVEGTPVEGTPVEGTLVEGSPVDSTPVDSTAPQVSIDEGQPLSTAASEISLQGVVTDSESEIAELFGVAQRFGDVELQVNADANGRFELTIPLLRGANPITLVAIDTAGNRGSTSLSIERAVSQAPVLVVSEPAEYSSTSQINVIVKGIVYTQQARDQIAIQINEQAVSAEGDGGSAGYAFTSAAIPLNEGQNTISVTVTSPDGDTSRQLNITRIVEQPPESVAAPGILITRPLADAVSSSKNITVQGRVSSESAQVTLTVNGVPTALSADGSFNTIVPLATCTSVEEVAELLATDANGQTTGQSVALRCDDSSPVISVLSPSNLSTEQTNSILENPLSIEGLVEDAQLASLTLNGQSLELTPTTVNAQYRFQGQLSLPEGELADLTLVARDRAANQTSLSYSLLADSPVSLQIISPAQGSAFSQSAQPQAIEILARVAGLNERHSVQLSVNDGEPQPMIIDGETARFTSSFVLQEGENTLLVEVVSGGNAVIARASRQISSNASAEVTLAMLGSEPAAESEYQLPNTPLTVYFNQADMDIDQIELVVTQSVHGPDYDLTNQKGAGFTEIPEPALVEVHKDHEAVPGSVARYAGEKLVSFYPDDVFHYGATVFVDVLYQNDSLQRYSFQVQDLPTRIGGIVTDPVGNALAGIDVALPELGLTTQTSSNGNFDFGAGQTQRIAIASGRYRLVINPEQANPAYGVVEQWANVQQSRINTLGRFQLPAILSDEPFVALAGGEEVSLYQGALQLDMSDASLSFANGRDRGNAQVQMLLAAQLPHSATVAAVPTFAWHLQPSGIEVSGDVQLTINIPPFRGGYEHVPPTDTRVVLLGFDDTAKQLLPVGTGRVDGRQIHSIGSVAFSSLDYIAYAIVPESVYSALWEWEQGEIDSLAQLHSRLLEAAE